MIEERWLRFCFSLDEVQNFSAAKYWQLPAETAAVYSDSSRGEYDSLHIGEIVLLGSEIDHASLRCLRYLLLWLWWKMSEELIHVPFELLVIVRELA